MLGSPGGIVSMRAVSLQYIYGSDLAALYEHDSHAMISADTPAGTIVRGLHVVGVLRMRRVWGLVMSKTSMET